MKRSEDLPRICALCKNAVFTYPSNDKDAPPLALFLKSDPMDEERVLITCPYRKEVSCTSSCRRFRFDPLKYRPKKAPAIQALDAEALLLD